MKSIVLAVLVSALALSSAAAAATSCVGRPLAVTLNADGTAHLYFEDSVVGYDPIFEPPSVTTIDSSGISIEQRLTDSSNYMLPGAAPTRKVCHAAELDLGVLAAGPYSLEWDYLVTLAGGGPYRFVSRQAFVWSGSEVLCTLAEKFSTDPITPIAKSGVLLSLTRMSTSLFIEPTTATVIGNHIEVADYVNTEVPPVPFPGTPPPRVARCQTTAVSVPPLAEGEYAVHWKIVDRFGPTIDEGMYTFVVGPQGRRRAAR